MLAADNLKVRVFKDVAPVNEIFRLIQKWGNVDDIEMYSTFNMGIGTVLCVSETDADGLMSAIQGADEQAYKIGAVEIREEGESNIVIV